MLVVKNLEEICCLNTDMDFRVGIAFIILLCAFDYSQLAFFFSLLLFSPLGTPNALLPIELNDCHYEKGF